MYALREGDKGQLLIDRQKEEEEEEGRLAY